MFLLIFQLVVKAVNGDKNTTKIIDIPLEVLLDIYEQLDMNSLAAVGKTHPYNLFVTQLIYQNKYNVEMFNVNGSKIFDKTNVNSTHELDRLLNTFETFAPLITKLNLNFYNIHFNAKQIERFNQHISKYLADSLIDVQIEHFKDKHLNGLIGLHKVENVRLAHGSIKTNLNVIFPAMHRLDPKFMRNILPESIEHHFPQLQELTMEILSRTCSDKFERRIRLNPQLKKIDVWICTWPSLQMIKSLLPNLEQFYVTGFDGMTHIEDDIHFEHLKAFGIHGVESFPRNVDRVPIVFGNLEEIVCHEGGHKCFDIYMDNKKLKQIECGELNENQLQQIVEQLPYLETIKTWHRVQNETLAIDTFIRFIETGKRLKEVKASKIRDGICNAFYGRLNDWKCVEEEIYFVLSR